MFHQEFLDISVHGRTSGSVVPFSNHELILSTPLALLALDEFMYLVCVVCYIDCLWSKQSQINQFRLIRWIVLIESWGAGYRRGNLQSRQCYINIHAFGRDPYYLHNCTLHSLDCNCSIVLWSKWPRDMRPVTISL